MLFGKLKIGLVTAIAVCLTLVTVATAGMVGWHRLQQSQRDMAILARARQDRGSNVGLECKEWVRKVVKDASGNEVIIPSTRTNDYEWNSHQYVSGFQRSCPPQGIAPGRIIQMKWRNRNGNVYPNTAIVTSSDANGMNWIDANWQNHDGTVRTRYVSYNDFERAVSNNFTVYKIR